MRLRHLLATAIVIGAGIGTPLRAQAPSGINKASHDSSKIARQAGVAGKKVRHTHVLTKASKNTKAGLKRATSATSKTHHAKHKARAANKVAHKVSQAGKATGTAAKHRAPPTSNGTPTALTKTGKDNKDTTKRP